MVKHQLIGDRYLIENFIGEGSQGKIILVQDTKEDNKKKALKYIHGCDKDVLRELKFLKETNMSPFVIKIFDIVDELTTNYIILEYHKCGDLDEVIKSEKNIIPRRNVKRWGKQLLEAISYIHSKGVIHRDIKPQNILVTVYNDIVLCDFGIAVHPETMKNSFKGSLMYMSPQILENEPYDAKTDEWSFGCVVYELFTLKKAFEETGLSLITKRIINCNVKMPYFDDHHEIEFMITRTLVKNTSQRKSAREILDYLERHKLANRYFKIGDDFQKKFNIPSALQYYEKSLEIKKNQLNSNDKLGISIILDRIGQCRMASMEYEIALDYFDQAKDLRNDLSKHSIEFEYCVHKWNSLINFADCQMNLSSNKKALDSYLESISLMDKFKYLNDQQPKLCLAISFCRIGECLYAVEKQAESFKYYDKSLSILRKLFNDQDNEHVARTLNNFGNCQIYLNDLAEGKEKNLKALKMRQRLFAADRANHPDVAQSLFDVANAFEKSNDVKQALDYFKQSLKMYECVFDNQDHVKVKACLDRIGSLYTSVDNHQYALDYYYKSLQMSKGLFKNNKQNILPILKNIVSTYKQLNDTVKCAKYQTLIDEIENDTNDLIDFF